MAPSNKKIAEVADFGIKETRLLLELEKCARRWRAGIDANRKEWSIKNTKLIQAAGRDMYRIMDELELLRRQ